MRGRRTLTFDGKPRGEKDMIVDSAGASPTPSRVAQSLDKWHAPLMAQYRVELPPLPDQSRLTDGTCFLARGERDPAGATGVASEREDQVVVAAVSGLGAFRAGLAAR